MAFPEIREIEDTLIALNSEIYRYGLDDQIFVSVVDARVLYVFEKILIVLQSSPDVGESLLTNLLSRLPRWNFPVSDTVRLLLSEADELRAYYYLRHLLYFEYPVTLEYFINHCRLQTKKSDPQLIPKTDGEKLLAGMSSLQTGNDADQKRTIHLNRKFRLPDSLLKVHVHRNKYGEYLSFKKLEIILRAGVSNQVTVDFMAFLLNNFRAQDSQLPQGLVVAKQDFQQVVRCIEIVLRVLTPLPRILLESRWIQLGYLSQGSLDSTLTRFRLEVGLPEMDSILGLLPARLEHLCRCAVRDSLGESLPSGIYSLGLGVELQEFLNLRRD